MKKLLLFLFAVLAYYNLLAQDRFAPIGAEWYHDQQYGAFHATAVKDTVYGGHQCTKINEKAITDSTWYSHGYATRDHYDMYMYSSGDTVYIYNDLFQKFTPLYIFYVFPGDTLHIPLLNVVDGFFTRPANDTTFLVVVDSVKLLSFDTATFKAVYTRPIDVTDHNVMSYNGPYVQRLGALYTGFIPSCSTCGSFLDMTKQPSWGLICYHDSTHSIQLIQEPCDKGGIETGIETVSQISKLISLSPNPANDKIKINNQSGEHIACVSIMDINGKALINYSKNIPEYINIARLPAGLYFVNLELQNGPLIHKKLEISR